MDIKTDGTVKSHKKIPDTEGGFTGTLDNNDRFGNDVSGFGDLNGDGVQDIVVGARMDDDGGNNRGAVNILNLPACTNIPTEHPTEAPTQMPTQVPTEVNPTVTPSAIIVVNDLTDGADKVCNTTSCNLRGCIQNLLGSEGTCQLISGIRMISHGQIDITQINTTIHIQSMAGLAAANVTIDGSLKDYCPAR